VRSFFYLTRFLTATPTPGTPGAPAPAPAPPAVSPARTEQRASDLTTRMIAEYGSTDAALRAMSLRALAAEDEREAARRERDAGKLPDGAKVITKEEVAALAKLQVYGTPDEIEKKLKRGAELETEMATTKVKASAREAATAAGLDPEAFEQYALDKKLPIEMRDTVVTTNGKRATVKLPYVRKPEDDKAPWTLATEYVATLPAFEQRALKATPGSTSASAAPAATSPAATTAYPPQARTPPTAGDGDAVDAFIKQRDARNAARHNPLFPVQPTPAPVQQQ
jgi:hypothetical protein